MRCLRASSSASPGSVWGVRAQQPSLAGSADCGGMAASSREQGSCSVLAQLPGDTWQSPQALSAPVIRVSPLADILSKYAKQKLPLVQEGLNLLSRGVSAIRSSAHHLQSWSVMTNCCFRPATLRTSVGLLSPSSRARSWNGRRMFKYAPKRFVLLRAGCFNVGIRWNQRTVLLCQLISLLTLVLWLLQTVFKENFALLILSNISLEVLTGKHPA